MHVTKMALLRAVDGTVVVKYCAVGGTIVVNFVTTLKAFVELHNHNLCWYTMHAYFCRPSEHLPKVTDLNTTKLPHNPLMRNSTKRTRICTRAINN